MNGWMSEQMFINTRLKYMRTLFEIYDATKANGNEQAQNIAKQNHKHFTKNTGSILLVSSCNFFVPQCAMYLGVRQGLALDRRRRAGGGAETAENHVRQRAVHRLRDG